MKRMRPDGWPGTLHPTEDVTEFLDRAGHFLRSRPTCMSALSWAERVRTRGT
jgi:hypothetical protein